jgi:Subtilase family
MTSIKLALATRHWWLAASLITVLLVGAAPTHADESQISTKEAVADHGVFLDYDPSPAEPVGICLVDTGVSSNSDTSGIVIHSEALDGGTPNDLSPELHGTLMAMLMAASVNGWGTVGVAPNAVRVISIRVTSEAEPANLDDYLQGITRCQYLAGHLPSLNIKVINLSLTISGTPGMTTLANLEDAVDSARNAGLDVVAAAGNEGAPQVDYPAAYPPVLAVGGNDTSTGQPCSFSNFGVNVDLFAPGCDLDSADPATGTPESGTYQGDSEAAAITSAAVGALRAYDTSLTPEQAEALVTSTTTAGNLNIASAFTAAGLGWLTSYGPAPSSPGSQTSAPSSTSALTTTTPLTAISKLRQRLPRPRVKLHATDHGRQLVVRVLNRPPRIVVDIGVLPFSGGHVLKDISARSSVFDIKSAGRRLRLRIRFIDPSGVTASSPTVQAETPRHLLH